MKKLGFLLISLFFVAVSVHNANAQDVSATVGAADASATILQTITLQQDQDLQFGAIGGVTIEGAVEIAPENGAATLINVTHPVASNVGQQAIFSGNGAPSATYSITLPTEAITLDGANGGTMNVTAFNHNAGETPTITAGGALSFNVGATLTVGEAQTPGVYQGTYSVSVAYN